MKRLTESGCCGGETHQVVSLVTKSEAHVNKAALEKRYCKDRVEKNCFGFFLFFSNDDDGRVLGTCCPVVRYRHSDRSVEHSFCFFGRHTERERRVGWRGIERGVSTCALLGCSYERVTPEGRAGCSIRHTALLLSFLSSLSFSLFSSRLSFQFNTSPPSVRPSSPREFPISRYTRLMFPIQTKQSIKKRKKEEKRKEKTKEGTARHQTICQLSHHGIPNRPGSLRSLRFTRQNRPPQHPKTLYIIHLAKANKRECFIGGFSSVIALAPPPCS